MAKAIWRPAVCPVFDVDKLATELWATGDRADVAWTPAPASRLRAVWTARLGRLHSRVRARVTDTRGGG
jgi:hypothetical protein